MFPWTTRKDLIAIGQLRQIQRCWRITEWLSRKLLFHRLLLVCPLFFLFLIVIKKSSSPKTHVWFCGNLIVSTGLPQHWRQEQCAGRTLASLSLYRLTSLSGGSRRVTEGGSHQNHCQGCELGGKTQTIAAFLRKRDWCWQVCEGWGDGSTWFTAWSLPHRTASYFKAEHSTVWNTQIYVAYRWCMHCKLQSWDIN